MTTEYKLVAFSRDVNLGISLGKHSGFGLVKYEDGVAVAMKTVEVTASSAFGNMNFANSNDFSSGYTDGWIPVNSSLSTGGNIVPEKVFENGQWKETTSDWVSDREYKTTPLKDKNGNDIGEPVDTYREIENNADLTNQSGMSYDPKNQNCNTWVGYVDDTLLGNVGVFDQLNEGLDIPDIYLGGDLPFPFPGSEMYLPGAMGIPGALMDYLKDKKILDTIEDIQAYLKLKGLSFRDVKCTMYMTLNNVCCTITYQTIDTVFQTPIPNPEKPPFTPIKQAKETAEVTPSPLIVDLDGDGVETTGVQSGTHFDHDGNGFAENTGWVGKDDGILVRDINGNGEIDNGTELFGNNSVLSNGEKAANGFEALKDLDSNNDGIFNNNDTAWNTVKVWKDANGNGYVEDGELLTLEQAGIAGINLGYSNQTNIDANGNQHAQTGTIIKADGTTGTITDVWFDDDKMNTVDKSDVVIPDDIKAMPDIAGFGNVHSLQVAMALDETGELKTLVEQYAATTDPDARDAILINLIYHWTGVQDMDPEGRNPTQVYGNVLGDSRKLEALEEFWGEEFLGTWCWGERDPNPHGKAAPYILQAFDDLKEYFKTQLNAQTHYKDLLDAVTLTYNETTQAWEADASAAVALLKTAYETDSINGMVMLREFSQIIKGYDSFATTVINAIHSYGKTDGTVFENELLSFGQWDNIGTAGNDTIRGTEINDYLNGYAGNDRLYGGDGNDAIVGGEGDDYLVGGNGDDVYRFNVGFGNDSLDNSQDETTANQDVVEFGEGILKENVTMDRQGYDLILKVSYPQVEGEPARPNDTLRIFSYFDKQGTTSATVSQIKFADGTTWNYEYVIDNWNSAPSAGGGIIVEGGNGNDTLNGTEYNDILIGNDGADTFYGRSGNDTFIGGKGNDYYDGNYGDDTFIWNWGDGLDTIGDGAGHDKIIFGIGISFNDLSFEAIPNGNGNSCSDLKITVKGNPTQGIIINNYMSNIDFRIEDLVFADGSRVHLSEIPLTLNQSVHTGQSIQLTANGDTIFAGGGNDTINGGNGDDTINGGAGNDTINGSYGNDILAGGKGNDYLDGSYGNDTFIWNLGDDLDTIIDGAGSEKLIFGEGITFDDLTFQAVPNGSGSNCTDLKIYVKGDETQGVIIRNYYSNNNYHIEELQFADGTTIPLPTTPLTLHQGINSENVTLTNNGDTIYANGGDDVIAGGNGDDTIYGGDGNDTITGGSGDDTLIGGKGNDTLNGNGGNNVYVWNLGDGLDTINSGNLESLKFGEGITLSSLSYRVEGNNLHIMVNGSETQGIICVDWSRGGSYRFKELQFADGSIVNFQTLGLTLNQSNMSDTLTGTNYGDIIYGNGGNDTITGGSGNDIIYGGDDNDIINGGSGNDILIGGKGNDTLNGNGGENTYIWNLGDDLDTIHAGNLESLEFGEGISLSNLSYRIEGNNLHIMVNGDETQGIICVDWSRGASYRFKEFRFADGSIVNFQTLGLTLTQSNISETLTATNYNDVIYANGGNDTINSGSGDDIIFGGAGNDTIEAGNGNDQIYGGTGNDILNGGAGDDVYYYNLGDGQDIITDSSGIDKIVFGTGISFEDIKFSANDKDLIMVVNNDLKQTVTIKDYFNSKPVEEIEFADQTNYYLDDLDFEIYGTDASEALRGGIWNDTIYGGKGNDKIYGDLGDDNLYGDKGDDYLESGDGNDHLYGGSGNDSLVGGSGNDVYHYELNDGLDTITDSAGTDTIAFGSGIAFSDLSFRQDGNNLIINVGDNRSQGLIIKDYFSSSPYVIEHLQFADGSIKDLNSLGLTFSQSDISETIKGTNYNDTIYGGKGNDVIYGYWGDDVLYGGEGNDTLEGGDANDHLYGGKGNDTLNGGYGNDTYHYDLGDGLNTIYDLAGSDTIVFGNGIAFSDLSFSQDGNNLIININGDLNQGFIIKDYFYGSSNTIERLQFADGVTKNMRSLGLTYSQSNISDTVNGTNYNDTIYAGNGNDTINSGNGKDIIYGGRGNDTINSGNGNDTIYGDEGNDILNGGAGNDEYHYNLGDGFDTINDSDGTDKIIFGNNITLQNLTFSRNENNLQIIINNDYSQGILINNQFSSGTSIEQLEFSDGSVFNLQDSGITFTQNYSSETISGTTHNDIIYGNGGNDIINAVGGNNRIYGGKGNDTLNGASGNDIYFYNLGDGIDTITEVSGVDKIVFGENISSEDLLFNKQGNNLYICINNSPTEGIIITNFFSADTIEQIEFSNGQIVSISKEDINLSELPYENKTIVGTSDNDTILGGSGNDTISAGNGNDIITGGKGDDYLSGNYGNDVYVWNLGDGFDTIYEEGGSSDTNTIRFGDGITKDDLTFSEDNGSLVITVKGNESEGLYIQSHFSNQNYYKINMIEFADGTTMNLLSDGLTLTQPEGQSTVTGTNGNDTIHGNSGNDTLNGGNGNDVINGNAGNDKIYAGNGNDIITGGKGDDYLSGNYGNDVYVWNLGDGFDTIYEEGGSSDTNTIRFGDGITKDDLTFSEDNGSLVITVKGNESEGLYIQSHFSNQSYYKINIIEFADGTTMNLLTDGLTLTQPEGQSTVTGTNGNDIIHGNSGNDTLNGGNGNDVVNGGSGSDTINAGDGANVISGGVDDDVLSAGSGNDTYIWNLGDGFDHISDSNGTDKLKFGEGITKEDLLFRKDNNALVITVKGDNTQGMRINNHTGNGCIESAEFADGSTLDLTNADQLIQAMSTFGADGSNGMDTMSNDPTSSVQDMYNLACSSDLSKRAA